MSLVLGIDSSTQSCTAQIRDSDSHELLGVGTHPHPKVQPPVAEQQPDDWWTAFVAALQAACDAAGVAAAEIAAVSFAGQCHGLVPLDAEHEVIRPAKLWNDTTSHEQAARLVARWGPSFWAKAVGSVPTAAFTITKMAWLAEQEPANFARLAHVLLPHEWLTFQLTGALITDRSEASGTGYFDDVTNEWRYDILADVDAAKPWPQMLPAVIDPNASAGVVSTEASAATGLRSGTVVAAGAGDQHAAALGLGIETGEVVYSLGTSGVVFTRSDTAVVDETGWVNSVADCTGGFLPLVCTLNATQVTDRVAQWLGVDATQLGALALRCAPDRDRPTFVPYLAGERTPNLPSARGGIIGLSLDTTSNDLARSAFEGVLRGLIRGERAIASHVELTGATFITGGGSRSPAYGQLLADLLGRELCVLDVPDATARGACLQAAAILTEQPVADLTREWRPNPLRTLEPRPGARDPRLDRQYDDMATWLAHHEVREDQP